ncbi:hypothetical protein [Streptomyces aureoversilis]|uniref:Uncharacterized protein n=1 Tax=Streptomyces aureoversilis TaxID=67277 RepID=A0ABW0A5B1_9ACTN
MEQKEQPKPLRPVLLDTTRTMARFEQRHSTAENPRREEFPDIEAPGAELSVVLFGSKHKSALPRLARRAEAIDRLVLIQQLRLLLDREELAALRDGNEAGATWRQLGDPLGITTKNGTVQRMQRLRVAVELGPSALRAPGVLRAHERGVVQDEDSRSNWVALNCERVRNASAQLLHHRAALITDEDADEWLDDLADRLEEPVGPASEASIIVHLRFAVEEIDRAAEEVGQEPASTGEAVAALKAARSLIGRYRSRSAP